MTNEHVHVDPYPTRDEQVYRIGGTTSGGAILGSAVASTFGGVVVLGALVGGVAGLFLAAFAANKAVHRNT